jgi:LmbE family N-acetylglucosaminyl deacetylase
VVITFGPESGNGHPDHIAISQFTSAAIMKATDQQWKGNPHMISKLYYMAWIPQKREAYQATFKDL